MGYASPNHAKADMTHENAACEAQTAPTWEREVRHGGTRTQCGLTEEYGEEVFVNRSICILLRAPSSNQFGSKFKVSLSLLVQRATTTTAGVLTPSFYSTHVMCSRGTLRLGHRHTTYSILRLCRLCTGLFFPFTPASHLHRRLTILQALRPGRYLRLWTCSRRCKEQVSRRRYLPGRNA